MIDVHAHLFDSHDDFSPDFLAQAQRAKGGVPLDLVTDYRHYWAHAPVDCKVIVFGGKARLAGLWVDDRKIAEFVSRDPDRLLGFMSLDPTQSGWEDELRHGHQDLGLRGIKLMPMYAGFYPQDRAWERLWSYAERHGLPVLLHTGTTFVSQAPINCTLPRHLDPVATRFPELRLVLAHLGHPYEGECVSVIRKHPHVYADISALHYRAWQFFHSLMLVQEYGVWDKVLFGSDYPFTTPNATIEGLRDLCGREMGGFRLDAEKVENMIHRDTRPLLGLI